MTSEAPMNEQQRLTEAVSIVEGAARLALKHFRALESLSIEAKGFQDVVSNADKEVEMLIRESLTVSFPNDAVVGEEFADSVGESDYTWVIDPIDGTANFVSGMPCWAVVLACVHQGTTIIGVVLDPVANECWSARRGGGVWLNGVSVSAAKAQQLSEGSTGVGLSNRVSKTMTADLLTSLIEADGIFYRNASGALMLAYVAGGRLIGYCEPHMNAWDCLASLLMIEEAGGRVEPVDMATVLADGCRVVVACQGVYQDLKGLCDKAYSA